MITDLTNKNEMPEFTPPEPSAANKWHCWHEDYNQGYSSNNGKKNAIFYCCCHCNEKAIFKWFSERIIPKGHGRYYQGKCEEIGQWSFEVFATEDICTNPAQHNFV